MPIRIEFKGSAKNFLSYEENNDDDDNNNNNNNNNNNKIEMKDLRYRHEPLGSLKGKSNLQTLKFSILLVSYFMWSGSLDSSDLLL